MSNRLYHDHEACPMCRASNELGHGDCPRGAVISSLRGRSPLTAAVAAYTRPGVVRIEGGADEDDQVTPQRLRVKARTWGEGITVLSERYGYSFRPWSRGRPTKDADDLARVWGTLAEVLLAPVVRVLTRMLGIKQTTSVYAFISACWDYQQAE